MRSFLDKLRNLHARADAPTATPQRMPATMLPPDSAPATMGTFPADFDKYQYAGPTAMTFHGRNAAGERMTVTSIGANMERVDGNPDDPNSPSSRVSMSVTCKDLRLGNHGEAEHIQKDLTDYYDKNIVHPRREPSAAAKTNARTPVQTAGLDKTGSSSLFKKLNMTSPS